MYNIYRVENHEGMTVDFILFILLNIISINAQILHENSEDPYQRRYFPSEE